MAFALCCAGGCYRFRRHAEHTHRMIRYLEQLVSSLWNRLQGRRQARKETGSTIVLGFQVADDEVSRRRVGLSPTRRTMHVALLGKTGTGKSSLLKSLCLQDIEAGRGFVYFDLHGDATPFLLRAIAAREWKQQTHLSDRLIVISPADREMSVVVRQNSIWPELIVFSMR